VSAAEEQAIRAFFRSWAARDEEFADDVVQDLVGRFFDPDVTYEEDPAWPGAATLHGWRAVTDRHLELRELLGRATATIESLRNAGVDRWAVAVRIAGESASGAPFEHLWGYAFKMRAGRIRWFRAYVEATRPFAELGLPAEDAARRA
jgi:ketosteroid isomerase-like protein